MRNDEFNLEAGVDAAWAGFRGRLADHLAGMEEDDQLIVTAESGVDEDDLEGCTPYLQFLCWDETTVRAEVSSNVYLDPHYALTPMCEESLLEIGWEAPRDEPGEGNFSTDAELRDADRVAVMAVAALRDVFGVAHPAFLDADGLELDPKAEIRPEPGEVEQPDEPMVAFPDNRDELQALVDQALAALATDELEHDDDGDIPFVAGRSMVFVRVLRDQPCIDLFSFLVLEVRDLERVPLELGLLNAGHPFAKFYLRGDRVVMRHRLLAWPFAPAQLRAAMSRMLEEVDELAGDLAARVDGVRFLEESRHAPTVPDDGPGHDDDHPSMMGLIEVLHEGPTTPSVVAALFDHDRQELIRQIVGLRSGFVEADGHDEEFLLSHLRRALRFVAERQARSERAALRATSAGPRSQQLSLMPESDVGDDTLDAGRWDREVS